VPMHVYEVRLRKDKRGFDLISHALPFGRLWYAGLNPVANVIGYATRDPASSLSQSGSIAHKSSFIPRPVRIVARQRTDFEDAKAPKVAERQGTFAAASSSRASDLSLIIVPGVGL
jgi:hypothetical protein